MIKPEQTNSANSGQSDSNALLGACERCSKASAEIERLRSVIECASNALRDSVLVSGNDVNTNMHFIRKMEKSLCA